MFVFFKYTDKKDNQIFLIYKEIQSGAVAKSYMKKGFLIYEEMRTYFPIYEEAVSHIWLCNCSILNFLIYEENLIFLFISVYSPSAGYIWWRNYGVNNKPTSPCSPNTHRYFSRILRLRTNSFYGEEKRQSKSALTTLSDDLQDTVFPELKWHIIYELKNLRNN